jgi:hypothetical protein
VQRITQPQQQADGSVLAGGSLSGNLSFGTEQINTATQFRITARGFGPPRALDEPVSRTVEATFQN